MRRMSGILIVLLFLLHTGCAFLGIGGAKKEAAPSTQEIAAENNTAENPKKKSRKKKKKKKRKSRKKNRKKKAEEKGRSRIIVYNALMTLETNQPDSVHKSLARVTQKYRGYVLAANLLQISLRVPAENLKKAMEEIETFGKVLHEELLGDDITEKYRDWGVRLDNALQSRKRYLRLLARSKGLEATLQVEKELERVNQDIDALKGKMERFMHFSEFSTITVKLQKPFKPGPLGFLFLGTYKIFQKLFIWDK